MSEDASQNDTAMATRPAKKVRSCSSSESTPNISSESHQSTPGLSATGLSSLDESSVAALIDAARRYETEASLRHTQAQEEIASAKEEVLAAMETLERAHKRLRKAEAVGADATKSYKVAAEFKTKWEVQLNPGKKPPPILSSMEHDEDQKHVSFAPQHAITGSSSVGSIGRKVKRIRIRVSEHGWGMYEGLLDSVGEPHGRGSVTWENGGRYDGEWCDGKANGHGIMDYANGDRYEGMWKDGCRFGQGTHHFKDGGVYVGHWRNAAPDGQGKMTLKNGSHYEGSWKDGKWHGPGIVRPVNGGEWEGTFQLGKCTVGTLRRPNGELEIGRYESVNPDDVKEGVWWSIDRQNIWKVENGQKIEQIDYSTALEISTKIGVQLPSELQTVEG